VKDQLFIRTPTGMVRHLAPSNWRCRCHHALAEMQRPSSPRRRGGAGEPTLLDRHHNYAAIVLAAPLWQPCRGARSCSSICGQSGTLDVFDLLDSGELDVAIGTSRRWASVLGARRSRRTGSSPLMRRGHPAGRSKLSRRPSARWRTWRFVEW